MNLKFWGFRRRRADLKYFFSTRYSGLFCDFLLYRTLQGFLGPSACLMGNLAEERTIGPTCCFRGRGDDI